MLLYTSLSSGNERFRCERVLKSARVFSSRICKETKKKAETCRWSSSDWNQEWQSMKLFFQSRFRAAGQYHFGELVDSSKDSHSRLCQKKMNFEGIFVYVWTVKLVHFIYIVFLHLLLSREPWIHGKMHYIFVTQMNYCHPQDFSCTYFVFHLGPKTADRIFIF